MIAPAKEIVFDGLDAGQLNTSRNIENLDRLPTDQASETALPCALI